MTTAWPLHQLGRLGESIRDVADLDVDAEYELWSVPSFADDRPEFVTGREIGSSKLRVAPGDILICKINPRINRVWRVREPINGCVQIASPEWLVFRPSERSGLDSGWLVHFLSSPKFRQLIESGVTGTTGSHSRAQAAAILAQLIPVPCLAEQRRIVAILGDAFEGIATVRANAENALQKARELFDGYLRDVFLAPQPQWLETTVERYIRFIDYRGKTPTKTSEGLRLITAKNVKKGFIQDEPMEFVAPESYDSWMTRGIPKPGDVLFTTEAPLGNVAQLDTDEKVVFAQRIIIMQADPRVLDSAFLRYLLLSEPMQAKLRAKATGATAQGIKASLLKAIPIAFPKSLIEQAAIVETLDAIREATIRLQELYTAKLASLDELRQVMFSRAFGGELSQSSADSLLTEVA